MISLVYVSSATSLISPEELSKIVSISQDNNARAGVTGVLLHTGGNFIQALEGESETVSDVFLKISKDPRHRQVKELIRESITERQFPSWSMGLLYMTDLPDEERGRCVSLIETSLLGKDGQSGSRTRRLLETFRKNMR